MNRRICIVDDHNVLAQSLVLALQARGLEGHAVLVTSFDETLGAVMAGHPDLVILDLHLGDDLDGTSMIRPLTDAGLPVLVVTASSERWEIAAAVEAGAIGFVSKSEPFDTLLAMIDHAVRGSGVLSAEVRQELLGGLRRHRADVAAAEAPFLELTKREQQVLAALVDGTSVQQIAERSCVSVPTVRSQVRAILQKLGVNSQLEAVAMANRHGWRRSTVRRYSR